MLSPQNFLTAFAQPLMTGNTITPLSYDFRMYPEMEDAGVANSNLMQPPLGDIANSGFISSPETPLSINLETPGVDLTNLAYTPPGPRRYIRGRGPNGEPVPLKDIFGPPVGPSAPKTYRLDVHQPYPGGPDFVLPYNNKGTGDWV